MLKVKSKIKLTVELAECSVEEFMTKKESYMNTDTISYNKR